MAKSLTTLSMLFLLAFFTSVATGNEDNGSSLSPSGYLPINVAEAQQLGHPYLADSRTVSSRSVDRDLFDLPDDPVGPPKQPEINRQLKAIVETSRKESASKGTAGSESGGSAEQSSPSSSSPASQNPPSPEGTSGSGVLLATEIIEGSTPGNLVAKLENGSYVGVTKTTEGYYDVTTMQKIVLNDEKADASQKSPFEINNILLIILAFGSLFAAIFIGFIAWDNQRRLEEAIVSQNQRIIGGGSDAFSGDLNGMEPETFSFSTDSLSGNSFDNYDTGTSFRTIA